MDTPNSAAMASANRCSDSESSPPDIRLSFGRRSSPMDAVISTSFPTTSESLASAPRPGPRPPGRPAAFLRGVCSIISANRVGTSASVLATVRQLNTFTMDVAWRSMLLPRDASARTDWTWANPSAGSIIPRPIWSITFMKDSSSAAIPCPPQLPHWTAATGTPRRYSPSHTPSRAPFAAA